jgi:hypothetical protein
LDAAPKFTGNLFRSEYVFYSIYRVFHEYLTDFKYLIPLNVINRTGFWWENARKRPFGRPRRRWEDEIKMDLRENGWGVWSGFTWLRIGTVGGLL